MKQAIIALYCIVSWLLINTVLVVIGLYVVSSIYEIDAHMAVDMSVLVIFISTAISAVSTYKAIMGDNNEQQTKG